MSQRIGNKQVFTLLEVAQSIKKTLQNRYGSGYWIRAEINKLNYYAQSGHCFPELVQKEHGKVVAQLNGTLWNRDFERINYLFQKEVKEPLKDGIKVLLFAQIRYEPNYGITLQITDIDPSFTLGDLESEKRLALQKLMQLGLLERNKKRPLPILPKRIAVISVQSSKGFADFERIIKEREPHFTLFYMLFPSTLQGAKAAEQIINQLNRIRLVQDHFDLVAIIRGGGGDVGLSDFNHFELSKTIAEFPLPVFTGIGHATNFTVSEMVSHTNAITPTKLAEILLYSFEQYQNNLEMLRQQIIQRSQHLLALHKTHLQTQGERAASLVKHFISLHKSKLHALQQQLVFTAQSLNQKNRTELKHWARVLQSGVHTTVITHNLMLKELQHNLKQQTQYALKTQKQSLHDLAQWVMHLDPIHTLKRGYSITYLNRSAMKDYRVLQEGDEICTRLFEGSIVSRVVSVSGPQSMEDPIGSDPKIESPEADTKQQEDAENRHKTTH